MIPLKEFITLAKALPRAGLTDPNANGICFILDKEGERIGELRFDPPEITIYQSYEYCDEVLERLGDFTDVSKEFLTSEEPPYTFEDDKPELTDYGEQLYAQNNQDG